MCADNPAITCAVDVDSRVVEESVQQTAQLSVSAFTEAFSQLLLDTVDGGDAGGNARLSLLGQGDQLGPPICRVRAADDVAELLELINQFAHRLRRHVRPPGQLGQPRTLGRDLRKDRGVGRLLGKAGAHHAVDDAKSQQAVRAAEQGNGVDGLRGLRPASPPPESLMTGYWSVSMACNGSGSVVVSIVAAGLSSAPDFEPAREGPGGGATAGDAVLHDGPAGGPIDRR